MYNSQLLMAWHPEYITAVTTVITAIENPGIVDRHHSSGTVVIQQGWKVLDVAPEYFSVSAFRLLREQLGKAGRHLPQHARPVDRGHLQQRLRRQSARIVLRYFGQLPGQIQFLEHIEIVVERLRNRYGVETLHWLFVPP